MWFAIGRDIFGRPIYDDRNIEDVDYVEVKEEYDEEVERDY